MYVYPQTNLESIRQQIEEIKPDTIVIDSIQAIYSQSITSSAGSVSQIRECCNILMQIAKTQNITIIIIGHVTKDGNIAGPKILEHMVDTVIYFEGDKYKSYRMLRSMKTVSEILQKSGFLKCNHKDLSKSKILMNYF